MVRQCCLCRKGKETEFVLHVFPRDEQLRVKWANACNINADRNTLIYVCSKHFCTEDYKNNIKCQRYLIPNAVPSLEVPHPPIISVKVSTSVQASTSLQASISNQPSTSATGSHIVKAAEYIIPDDKISDKRFVKRVIPPRNHTVDATSSKPAKDCSPTHSESPPPDICRPTICIHCHESTKKRRFVSPRYISEVSTTDLSTPGRAGQILNFFKSAFLKKTKAMKKLQDSKRYLQKRLDSMQDLLNQLSTQNLIDSDAEEMKPPSANATSGKSNEPPKSWKKINEERKVLKRKRKQDKLLKDLEKANKLEELTKNVNNAPAPKPNPSTVSIAVPGSILENTQSAELCTYVAGQIARAACIFRVNEIIVFDDVGMATARETKRNYDADDNEAGSSSTVRSSSLQLARILQYLECPQYLRKFFFPLHKDLKYSGLLNPLDAPHHLRQQNVFLYREGIICDKKAKDGHSYANVGLLNDVLVNKAIEPGVRVTVKLENLNETNKKLRGTVVSPDEPRRETGAYWGYTVRIAHSLSEIFTKSPYEIGYDLTIGTSDRGTNVHEVPNAAYEFNHSLIVFGGLKGLEAALANDDKLNVDDPALLFDNYVNVLPKQGSRTIRTEEAILIAMAALQEKLKPQVEDIEEELKDFLPRSEDTGGSSFMHATTSDHMFHVTKKQKKHKRAKMENPTELVELVEVNDQTELTAVTPTKTKNSKTTTSVVDPLDDFEFVAAFETCMNDAVTADDDDLSRFD